MCVTHTHVTTVCMQTSMSRGATRVRLDPPFEPALLEASKSPRNRSGEAAKRSASRGRRCGQQSPNAAAPTAQGEARNVPAFLGVPLGKFAKVLQLALSASAWFRDCWGFGISRSPQKPGRKHGERKQDLNTTSETAPIRDLLAGTSCFSASASCVRTSRSLCRGCRMQRKRGLPAQQLRCSFRQLFLPATQLAVVASARKRFGRPPVLCRRSTLLNSIRMAETRPCASQATPLIDTPACFRSDRCVQCTCFR